MNAQPVVPPGELMEYVAAQEVRTSPAEGWEGISVRSYRTRTDEVVVPGVSDYTLVLFPGRTLELERYLDGRRRSKTITPGAVSPLTRAADSHWIWDGGPADVTNVYLAPGELVGIGEQMYERDVGDVELIDRLDASDPELFRAVDALRTEAERGGPGSRLLIDSLRTQISVRLLRHQAHLRFREQGGPGTLTYRQEREVRWFVRENLRGSLTLDELAGVVGLSRFHFSRIFRRATGLSPHEFVLTQRLARARELIDRSDRSLGEIAAECGFADQSHMTRVFRDRLRLTPAAYRHRPR